MEKHLNDLQVGTKFKLDPDGETFEIVAIEFPPGPCNKKATGALQKS